MKRNVSGDQLLSGLYFKLLPYQVLLIIINAINGIADSIYASNYIPDGKSAMSAIGLFAPMNHFLYAASMMFVSGAQILYGRYLARDRHRINHLFTVTLTVSGGLALLTSGLLVTAAVTGATRVFTTAQPDLQLFNDYLLGQAIGIPALILGQQLFAFLSLENQRRLTMIASVACLAVNIIGNHLCIVVLGWGIFGLGLSSSVSMFVFLAIQAMFYLRGKSEWHFSVKGCDWHIAPKILQLGYSGALSRFVEMFRCLIVNFLMLRFVGSAGLSSFAASNAMMAIFWPVPFGMMAVTRMLLSISIGEEDRRSMADVMRITMTKGMLIVLVMAAGIILLAEPFTQLFYHDPADPVYHYTVMGFRLLPLCMPWSLLSLCYAAYVQATEKKIMSVVLPVTDGAAGVVACSLLLIPALGMNGLYISNILNGMICTVLIVAGAWLTLKRFPRSMEDLMAIPERIGVGEGERIDISVTGTEEVTDVSRRISEFCERRGIDRRRTYFASLCMEEAAGNVVEHGFTMDGKKHSADIRVVHKKDEMVLRIRDNCAAFDPQAYLKAMAPGECGSNVGIRLVYGIAKEVKYQNLLGMNVLTIRI